MRKMILIVAILSTMILANSVFAVNYNATNNNAGWVNVPLTDTKPFNIKCRYRAWLSARSGPEKNVFYAGDVLPAELFIYSVEDDHIVEPYRISSVEKGTLYRKYKKVPRTITKLEKYCKAPDTTPKNMVAIFASDHCPSGWNPLTSVKPAVSCTTSDCFVSICKKN